jgi:hypothetical protein
VTLPMADCSRGWYLEVKLRSTVTYNFCKCAFSLSRSRSLSRHRRRIVTKQRRRLRNGIDERHVLLVQLLNDVVLRDGSALSRGHVPSRSKQRYTPKKKKKRKR